MINTQKAQPLFSYNFYACPLCIIFFLLNIYVLLHEGDDVHFSFISVIGGFFLAPLLLSSGRFIALLCTPLLLSFSLFEAYTANKYDLITRPILRAIAGTNQHEAFSMLASYGVFPPLILLTFFIFITWLTYKAASLKLVLLGLSAIILSITLTEAWHKTNRQQPETQRYNISERGHWLRYFFPGIMGDLIYMTTLYISSDNRPSLPHLEQNSSIVGKLPLKEKNVILIIGESAFSGHHSTYGYTLHNTTPYMKGLSDEGELCVVPTVHSGANMTRLAVPMLLSFYEPTEQQRLYNEKNLIELARNNGYQTSWISSQEGTGEYARPYGYLSEYSDFIVRQDYHASENHVDWHDESLLPIVEKRFSTPSPYNFFIIHLTGSHSRYEDDVTKEDIQALPKANAYDKSLHRTDRILHQIIDLADKHLKDYVLLYLSDHGEIVDGPVKGHSIQYGGKDQYKIPFYIKSNTDHYCQQAESMRNSRGQYSSIMTKFLILEMLGYKIKEDTLKSYYNHDEVLHSDGVVYDYDHLPHK